MAVIQDATAVRLTGFVRDNSPAPTVHTDAWAGYRPLARLGYTGPQQAGRPSARSLPGRDHAPGAELMPRVHRVISNFKSWLQGAQRGDSGEHLQVYLDEYTFSFNRRRSPIAGFQTLLGLQGQGTLHDLPADHRGGSQRQLTPAEQTG